jgi:hypothetical protein
MMPLPGDEINSLTDFGCTHSSFSCGATFNVEAELILVVLLAFCASFVLVVVFAAPSPTRIAPARIG